MSTNLSPKDRSSYSRICHKGGGTELVKVNRGGNHIQFSFLELGARGLGIEGNREEREVDEEEALAAKVGKG